VVQDDVRIYGDTARMKRLYGGEERGPVTVLGPNRTLRVEFSEIVQIVDAVSDVIGGCCLGAGRKPYAGYAEGSQMGRIVKQAIPVIAVRRKLPLKILDHYTVCHTFS
jgi:hypothetical protein